MTRTVFSFSNNNSSICRKTDSCFYYYTIKKPKTPNLHFSSFQPSSCLPSPRGVRMDSSSSSSPSTATTTTPTPVNHHHHRRNDKVVVIMGATGCGKTSLSIDLASLYLTEKSEIINSDKMQVYKGLDITTNKIPISDRRSVPHHLLGEVSISGDGDDFSPADYRLSGRLAVDDIVSRHKLPIIVGGSNSFIYSLLVENFDPRTDVFSLSNRAEISTEFRYNCCFVWVDVEFPVLCDYLRMRVDEMLDSGMFEELCEFYDSGGFEPAGRTSGLRKAIGVPEFDGYFRKHGSGNRKEGWNRARLDAYEDAVNAIKENTCQLAKRQMGKILRLRGAGWGLQRVDATAAFRELMATADETTSSRERKKGKKKKRRWIEIWERDVLLPSVKIVTNFLQE